MPRALTSSSSTSTCPDGTAAVLADVKSDPDLRRIPVVVLTGSAAEEDVVRSYDLHANAYVTKPVDLQTFVEVVRRIDDFFISVVRLPST